MAKLTIGQRATKTAMLLTGLRDARIAYALRPYGLTNADIEKGWTLFMRAGASRLSLQPFNPHGPSRDAAFEAFLNKWFTLVKVTLAVNFPVVGEQVFLNLERSTGRGTVWLTAFFIERIDAMASGAAPYGKDGVAARDYLRTRGLSDEIVAEARALVEEARKPDDFPFTPASDDALARADEDMWNWYLEWSIVVRKAINNGNLLRLLGFKKRKAGRDDDNDSIPTEGVTVAPSSSRQLSNGTAVVPALSAAAPER